VARPGSEVVDRGAVEASAGVASGELPVRLRLIRKRPPKRAYGFASDLGPTNGILAVEAPLSALRFETRGSDYALRATVRLSVKDDAGKTVWSAQKDYALNGPLRRLDQRRQGSLYFLRTIQLPGGHYSLEADLEDQLAGQSGRYNEPLQATTFLPGFAISDAIFVREARPADKIEGDTNLSYDGKALAPLLAPVFQASQPFNLDLYFTMYLDTYGPPPRISLEILRDGRSVSRVELPFHDVIRDTSRENQDVGAGRMGKLGEQKGEFPYLASIHDAMFSAGLYEARVTVKQDKQTIARSASFRVVP
jgi:hypothetical protein